MNSSLPGSAILRSAAVFMLGLAGTLAGGLLLWPDATTRDAGIGVAESPAIRRVTTLASSHDSFARLADALAETDANRRTEALQSVAVAVAVNDVPTALEMAAQIAERRDKIDFLTAVFVEWAGREPAQALAHALTYSEASVRIATVSGALRTWSALEPHAALLWLADNLNESASLAAAKTSLQAAVDAWATTDLGGIQNWIAALPPGELRDRIRILLGEAQVEEHPAAAMRMTEAISDPVSRDATFIKLYRLWGAHDASAADAWLKESAPPQLRARLVRR